MPVSSEQLRWLEQEAEATLGLRASESKTLRCVLQLDGAFSYRQVASELGMTAEGVRLALAKFQRRGLIDLRALPVPHGARSFSVDAGPKLRAVLERLVPQARAV